MNITAGGFVDDEAKPLALRTDDLVQIVSRN